MSGIIDKLVTLGGREPRQVARTMIIFFITAYLTGKLSRSIMHRGVRGTFSFFVFWIYMSFIGQKGHAKHMKDIRRELATQLDGALTRMQKKQYADREKKEGPQKFESINRIMPSQGIDESTLMRVMREWSILESDEWRSAEHIPSGAIYHGGRKLGKIMSDAYGLFAWSNPLHPEIHPFIRKMESEIISMTCTLFNGNRPPVRSSPCGMVTSGGTESIMCCIRAYKMWAKEEKGIEYPELIMPVTAHAAFLKACEGWSIKPVIVPVDPKTHTMTAKVARKYINSNTIVIIGSAIQYAQGVMDPIADLSKLALEFGIGLHVDSCLGSFLIPTIRNLGYPVPPSDFVLPGVTSISCDTHKFGFSVKGTSVAMFRDPHLRQYTFWTFPESPIGLYATPTIAGSRPGGLVAATWACMMSLGESGYQNAAKSIMEATAIVKKAINETEGIRIMGNPPASVIGIESTDDSINIFGVSGAMSKRGWSLNNCQNPSCTHVCVTYNNYKRADKFARDIRESVEEVLENPDEFAKSGPVMYGTLLAIPDPSFKSAAVKQYLEICLDPPGSGLN